jgi:hypothetical protein
LLLEFSNEINSTFRLKHIRNHMFGK